MNKSLPPDQLRRLMAMMAEKQRRDAKKAMSQRGYFDDDGQWQGGLYAFVKYYWDVLEPGTPFVDGWALWAICQHLEAVTFGEITRLLINVPPGFMKSLLTDVFWPAWEWGPMDKAHLRYVAFSYSSSLTERDNSKFGILLSSSKFQSMWGDRVKLRKNGEKEVTNRKHGRKLATSIGGVGTGERGNRVIFDDPHNVKESESETVRTETVRFFREALSNRLNDIERDAIVVIMQRVHQNDVSGEIIDAGMGYCHLMIPMEYDWDRGKVEDEKTGEIYPFATDIGWIDPRWNEDPEECNGLLAWPERFSPKACAALERDVGPHAWAGQYQQTPKSRGASIIKREYWGLWADPNGSFPAFEYIVASLDSAFTEKQHNDPSGLTVWGVYRDDHERRRIMLIHAKRMRLQMHGIPVAKKPMEHVQVYRARAMKHWGLVETVADVCRRFQVDKLLVEAKASGITAAQEFRRLHGREGWGIELINPKSDKHARTLAVEPTWSQGLIYAPDREWAEMVIEEMDLFPKATHDDLHDSATQAIKHLRDNGMANSDEEESAEERELITHANKKKKPLYPV